MALLTLPSVGRCGAVFAFASWADVAIVTLLTRTLLKSPRFVVVFLRTSFKRRRLGGACLWSCAGSYGGGFVRLSRRHLRRRGAGRVSKSEWLRHRSGNQSVWQSVGLDLIFGLILSYISIRRRSVSFFRVPLRRRFCDILRSLPLLHFS